MIPKGWEQHWPHGWYVPNCKWFRKRASKRAREKKIQEMIKQQELVRKALNKG